MMNTTYVVADDCLVWGHLMEEAVHGNLQPLAVLRHLGLEMQLIKRRPELLSQSPKSRQAYGGRVEMVVAVYGQERDLVRQVCNISYQGMRRIETYHLS